MRRKAWLRASCVIRCLLLSWAARALLQTIVVWPMNLDTHHSTTHTLRLTTEGCIFWPRRLSRGFTQHIEARTAAATSEAAVSHPWESSRVLKVLIARTDPDCP